MCCRLARGKLPGGASSCSRSRVPQGGLGPVGIGVLCADDHAEANIDGLTFLIDNSDASYVSLGPLAGELKRIGCGVRFGTTECTLQPGSMVCDFKGMAVSRAYALAAFEIGGHVSSPAREALATVSSLVLLTSYATAYSRAAQSLMGLTLPLDDVIEAGRLRELPGFATNRRTQCCDSARRADFFNTIRPFRPFSGCGCLLPGGNRAYTRTPEPTLTLAACGGLEVLSHGTQNE